MVDGEIEIDGIVNGQSMCSCESNNRTTNSIIFILCPERYRGQESQKFHTACRTNAFATFGNQQQVGGLNVPKSRDYRRGLDQATTQCLAGRSCLIGEAPRRSDRGVEYERIYHFRPASRNSRQSPLSVCS